LLGWKKASSWGFMGGFLASDWLKPKIPVSDLLRKNQTPFLPSYFDYFTHPSWVVNLQTKESLAGQTTSFTSEKSPLLMQNNPAVALKLKALDGIVSSILKKFWTLLTATIGAVCSCRPSMISMFPRSKTRSQRRMWMSKRDVVRIDASGRIVWMFAIKSSKSRTPYFETSDGLSRIVERNFV